MLEDMYVGTQLLRQVTVEVSHMYQSVHSIELPRHSTVSDFSS